jgi:hypothetical protein
MEFKPAELVQWIPEASGDINIPHDPLNVAAMDISSSLRTVGQPKKNGPERG